MSRGGASERVRFKCDACGEECELGPETFLVATLVPRGEPPRDAWKVCSPACLARWAQCPPYPTTRLRGRAAPPAPGEHP